MQRRSGEDVVRETLAPVPTPPAEDVALRRRVTPFASPRLASYLGLAALGLIAALALRRAELVVVAAPFALIVAAGLLLEGRPQVRRVAHGRSRPRPRGRRDRRRDRAQRATPRSTCSSSTSLIPRGPHASSTGDNPVRPPPRRRRGADAAADAPLRPLGLGRARRHPPARAWTHRDARLGGSRPPPAPAADLPAPRAPPEPRGAARDAARDRATSSPGSAPTASSSPTRAASCPATGCARSTGGRAPVAAS